jgi:hypothetical protein
LVRAGLRDVVVGVALTVLEVRVEQRGREGERFGLQAVAKVRHDRGFRLGFAQQLNLAVHQAHVVAGEGEIGGCAEVLRDGQEYLTALVREETNANLRQCLFVGSSQVVRRGERLVGQTRDVSLDMRHAHAQRQQAGLVHEADGIADVGLVGRAHGVPVAPLVEGAVRALDAAILEPHILHVAEVVDRHQGLGLTVRGTFEPNTRSNLMGPQRGVDFGRDARTHGPSHARARDDDAVERVAVPVQINTCIDRAGGRIEEIGLAVHPLLHAAVAKAIPEIGLDLQVGRIGQLERTRK